LAYFEQTKNESLVAVVGGSAVIITMAGLKATARQERFNGKRGHISTQIYFALHFLCKAKLPRTRRSDV